MYVVILGGGRIGRYIAEDMVAKRHEVTILERDRDRAEFIVSNYPVLVIQGDGCDVPYLKQAHVERADVFVATTHEDDNNLVACQLAMIQFGVTRTISRVNAPKNVEIFEALGIEAVSSTQLISELLENEFTVGDLIHLNKFKGGRISLVELRIPAADDPGAPPPRLVSDLDLPDEMVLVAIFRGDQTLIPRGTTAIVPGDEVVALTTPDGEELLRRALLGLRR